MAEKFLSLNYAICSLFNPYPANVENMVSSYYCHQMTGFNSAFNVLSNTPINAHV